MAITFFEELLNRKLFNTRLNEARAARQLKPAIIYMKRGTVIEVDHARQIITPKGTPLVVAGIGPGRYVTYPRGAGLLHRPINKMRDFWAPTQWVPTSYQDETGWCEPDPDGRYDAHRHCKRTCKFRKVLTMHLKNVERIEWL